jgi:PD-(D/E)XK nuclease superfamily
MVVEDKVMARNLIDIFARGNQELFHSAFLAWLLDDGEPHGLGKSFRSELLSQLGRDARLYDPEGDYEIATEHRSGHARFDIFLKPVGGANERKGIVLENKIKSFGNCIQLDKYKDQGYDVVVLALLPETLDDESRQRYFVVNYATICDILKKLPLRPERPYHFLIIEYQSFLEKTLNAYSAITQYCNGTIDLVEFFEFIARATQATFSDNDVRTFSYFYYHSLAEFIKKSAADLVFGAHWQEAIDRKVNTRWHCEKNMQGPPFMEAIIFQPFEMQGWKLHSKFRALHDKSPVEIAPRLELWLDLSQIASERRATQEVGSLKLGTWNSELKLLIKQLDPHRTTLKPKPRADRNFHCEPVQVGDLPFSRMTQRIRAMMRLIFDENTKEAERSTVFHR